MRRKRHDDLIRPDPTHGAYKVRYTVSLRKKDYDVQRLLRGMANANEEVKRILQIDCGYGRIAVPFDARYADSRMSNAPSTVTFRFDAETDACIVDLLTMQASPGQYIRELLTTIVEGANPKFYIEPTPVDVQAQRIKDYNRDQKASRMTRLSIKFNPSDPCLAILNRQKNRQEYIKSLVCRDIGLAILANGARYKEGTYDPHDSLDPMPVYQHPDRVTLTLDSAERNESQIAVWLTNRLWLKQHSRQWAGSMGRVNRNGEPGKRQLGTSVSFYISTLITRYGDNR